MILHIRRSWTKIHIFYITHVVKWALPLPSHIIYTFSPFGKQHGDAHLLSWVLTPVAPPTVAAAVCAATTTATATILTYSCTTTAATQTCRDSFFLLTRNCTNQIVNHANQRNYCANHAANHVKSACSHPPVWTPAQGRGCHNHAKLRNAYDKHDTHIFMYFVWTFARASSTTMETY